jgi:cobalt/nickel transport system permease protein
LIKFTGIFAVTQVPIAIIEGILTVLVVDLLYAYNRQEVESLRDMSIGGEQA